MTERFVSVYEGMSGRRVDNLPAAHRRAMWEQDRQAIADLWFDGDAEKADVALDAMPYSSIPDWSDVDRAARAFREVKDG